MRVSPTVVHALLRRRALGELHPTAKIGWNARITNLSGNRSSLRIGKHSRIDGEIIVYPGARVQIGDFCYVGPGSRIWAYASVDLHDYVIVAHNVSIMDSTTHPISFSERKKQVEEQLTGVPVGQYDLKSAPIIFEEGAWVCAGATILRGVHIDREAIISAGCVVREDVMARTLYR